MSSSQRSPKRRPTHPGEILREDVLPELKMTQTELAERLDVSRVSVSELLHERRALSADMAMRLAKLLNTTAESWLAMQAALDLWELRQQPGALRSVKPLPPRSQGRLIGSIYTTDSVRPRRRGDKSGNDE
jgi:addiction module HigA family antidote